MTFRGLLRLTPILLVAGCPAAEKDAPIEHPAAAPETAETAETENVNANVAVPPSESSSAAGSPAAGSPAAGSSGAAPSRVAGAAAAAQPCAAAPAWSKISACTHDGWIYATGSVSGVANQSLARTAAANRARAELSGATRAVLEGSEVIDVYGCDQATHALARVRAGAGAKRGLPACDGAAVSARSEPPAGCPDWTQKVAWKDGSNLAGVGVAEGIMNRDLAMTTAQNRARAEIAGLMKKEISKRGGASKTFTAESLSVEEVDRKEAECGGALFVLLVVKPS